MKPQIQQLVQTAIQLNAWPIKVLPPIQIERTRNQEHGDYACNIAMLLAKPLGLKPRDIAQAIVKTLPTDKAISKVEIAGPGFINFFLEETAHLAVIKQVLSEGENYGRSKLGAGQKVLLEFVSANPTGPLHVGHGRGAAYGAAVADLLDVAGFTVQREYYVNDAGRQMDILATSVWLRYLELLGAVFRFPSNGYKGTYIKDIAAKLRQSVGDTLYKPMASVLADVPADETAPGEGDKEAHIDGLIANAKLLLGESYRQVFDLALEDILTDIKDDLAGFGIIFQQWFSERSFKEQQAVQQCLTELTTRGHTYTQDGALWFRSTHFGDDKDRVLLRKNGESTYFAADIAYHLNKLQRGFTQLIDVMGADHHGYLPRLTAALQALGYMTKQLKFLTVQFAILYRGGERVQMSTRSGEFVTLRELREEVGKDACRFFYVMRKSEQHMDFDLDLAKSQSSDNPVYYIQYAHARIYSVLAQLAAKHMLFDQVLGLESVELLTEAHEKTLLTRLSLYPEVIETAALACEPHQVAQYLRDLANDFHTYYNAHQFLVADDSLRNARLCLISAVRHVLVNGLTLLGVSAPQVM